MLRSIPTEDRISSLSDPIVCHILSFLPTKNSAATSILSKRWKPLWLSVSTLQFDDKTFPNYDSFFKFVSSVFLSRDITLPLQSFNLICEKASSLDHQHDINLFLQAAVQRGIKNLNLEMTSTVAFQIKLPPIVFSCKTLVVLHLSGLLVNSISQVVVDFPLLKTLHLSFVTFAYDEYLLKLLSGCPILEELQIDWIDASNVDESLVLAENFQCLPNLIRANIFLLFCGANVLFPLLCRANILIVDLDACYSHFPVFQNLIYMELFLKHKHCEEWHRVIEVLNRCPKLQNIIIYEYYGSGEEVEDNWMDPAMIIPECLSTQLKTCLLKGFKCSECGIQFAKYIMQNSKVLNTMSIKSLSSLDMNAKYQMLMKLTSWTRASSTCKLLFDW